MRNISKKSAFRMTAVAGVSLLAAAAIAPGAIAAGTVGGDVTVSNTETVQVLMDASGKIDSQRVYEQLELTGKGNVDIANPVSTTGLRNLDGFGGYDVRDGKVRVNTDVDGTKNFRSVSDFTKKLPLDISVGYFLDGKKVDPGDVVGKDGDLEVRYRVTNNTGVSQDVPFKDGMGADTTSPESVVIPMVGSVTTTLPSNFTKVQSAEANAAGDGRGGTSLTFTMTLIPPIGKNFADFGYTAHVTDGVIPKASISALPVNPLQSPSFKGGAESYKGGATTGAELTAGATEIDANVLKLRDGASDLVAGILKLQDGASQLSTGLNNDAVPVARKVADGAVALDDGAKLLSDGTGDLNDGAKKLDVGAGALADGLTSAGSKAPALLGGIDQLAAGGQLVDSGLVQLKGAVNAGVGTATAGDLTTLRGGVATILAGINAPRSGATVGLIAGVNEAIGGLNLVLGYANSLPASVPYPGLKEQIVGTVTAVITGLNDGKTKISSQMVPGLSSLDAGLVKLNSEVAAGVGTATSTVPNPTTGVVGPSLRNGVAQLVGGLGELKTGGLELVDGLGQLSTGANQLADGTVELKAGASKLDTGAGTLQDGTGELSAGAGLLSGGLGTAAAGSNLLADGLNQAAASAPALPEGADRLSKEGTQMLIEAGDATASDYGLKYALIEAGADRAATAQPYGSPEGATQLTAYKFELAGADGAGSANVKRGLAAIVLLAAAAGIAAIRSRA